MLPFKQRRLYKKVKKYLDGITFMHSKLSDSVSFNDIFNLEIHPNREQTRTHYPSTIILSGTETDYYFTLSHKRNKNNDHPIARMLHRIYKSYLDGGHSYPTILKHVHTILGEYAINMFNAYVSVYFRFDSDFFKVIPFLGSSRLFNFEYCEDSLQPGILFNIAPKDVIPICNDYLHRYSELSLKSIGIHTNVSGSKISHLITLYREYLMQQLKNEIVKHEYSPKHISLYEPFVSVHPFLEWYYDIHMVALLHKEIDDKSMPVLRELKEFASEYQK